MKLGKPPVVEASIQFFFESSASEASWSTAHAFEFLEKFRADYSETEVRSQSQLEPLVAKYARSSRQPVYRPKRVDVALRSFPPDRSRYIEIAKDLLNCIRVRGQGGDYPGFSVMKSDAMEKLENYVSYFRPVKLLQFVLGYVDYFRIPFKNKYINLSDYFVACKEPDESIFGATVSFRKAYTTRVDETEDIMTCEIYNVANRKTPGVDTYGIPFRIEWSLHAFKDVSWEPDQLMPRLQKAHAHLLKCFKATFTLEGWNLFDPEITIEAPL